MSVCLHSPHVTAPLATSFASQAIAAFSMFLRSSNDCGLATYVFSITHASQIRMLEGTETMDSAHAALRTYELLEAILLSLPPTDITRVMRVCKTWHKITLESSRLREARVLRHLPFSRTEQSSGYESDAWIPSYPATAGMRLNPIFASGCDYSESGDIRITRMFIFPANVPRLRFRQEEYATFPPCTTVTLETCGDARSCTVYIRTGIRIKDLLECAGMLCSSRAEDWGGTIWGVRLSRTADAIGKLIGCSTATL